jgi:biopolymer transport protein ExbD
MFLSPLLPATLVLPAPRALAAAPPAPKSADYKRADMQYYPRGDVLRADPGAVILPATAFMQNGDTYTFTPKKKAPKTLYLEAPVDWIEPITPPNMPASLDIPPDQMQIREPQGDVEVALPNAPSSFAPVTDGMTLPNGAVIKTADNATAAILFGGVDSARLLPHSEAAVQQTVTPTSRQAEVDLTAGGAFSKVGTQMGVTGEYQVHTPSGNAMAHGGDFATVIDSGRTDVWVFNGLVEMVAPDGKPAGNASGTGAGALRLVRYPTIANPAQALPANAATFTTLLDFIPMANQKVAALKSHAAKGTPLNDKEQAYLARIKQVPALIKLAYQEPPPLAPPAPATPPPVVFSPAPATKATPMPATPLPSAAAPASLAPLTVQVRPNGSVRFQGATMALGEFATKLKAMVKATPERGLVIKAGPHVPYDKIRAVLDCCVNAQVAHVDVPPPPMPVTAETPPASMAAPPAPAEPSEPATNAAAATPPPVSATPPIEIDLNGAGETYIDGIRLTDGDLKAKLSAAAAVNPAQALILVKAPQVTRTQWKKVVDLCHGAKLKVHLQTATSPAAVPPPFPAPSPAPATNANPLVEEIPAPTSSTNSDVMPATPEESTAVMPAPRIGATPTPQKLLPVEIVLGTDGQITLDGEKVTEDVLKDRLENIAKVTPRQPVTLDTQTADRAEEQRVVALCRQAKLRVHRAPKPSSSGTTTLPALPAGQTLISPPDQLPLATHPALQPLALPPPTAAATPSPGG